MEPVRCAVIGVGMMGASHVGVLNGLTSANLIGCCDVDSKSRSRVPEGVRFYESVVPIHDPKVFDRYPDGIIAP